MAAQTFRARGMSFPPDDNFGWLDDLYAVPSTGESDGAVRNAVGIRYGAFSG